MLIRGYSAQVLDSVFDAPRQGHAGIFDIIDQHRTRSLYCTYFVPAEARTGQGRKEERNEMEGADQVAGGFTVQVE